MSRRAGAARSGRAGSLGVSDAAQEERGAVQRREQVAGTEAPVYLSATSAFGCPRVLSVLLLYLSTLSALPVPSG